MEKIVYEGNGERLDVFLSKNFEYSRNFFHHLISRGAVSVNNTVKKKSYQLNKGDEIIIQSMERFVSPQILDEAPNIDLPVKLEKNDYMIIYKPKGVLSHPNSVWDVSNPSVVGFLYHKYKDLPSIGNFIRAGLIHRLDKETDGLMIIVKTESGLTYFKSLFQQKSLADNIEEKEKVSLKKFYNAKVNITHQGENFIKNIQLPYYIQEIVKTKNSYVSEFKEGITKILHIDIDDDQAKLDLEILTGRTHQIRYHLSNHGLPIIGDDLYGLGENVPMRLTAYRLIFIDNEGKDIDISI